MVRGEYEMLHCKKEMYTLNIDEQLNAKEYQLKIAQGIVGGFS